MRQILLCVSILMIGISWTVAQSSGGAYGQTGQSKASGGGHMTVEGCLSGSDGNYTLTDKNGNSYQLTGDTAKLSEHVGHEVKITGTSSAAEAGAGSASASGSTGSAAGQSLQVSSVKHISKTCQSSGGTMAH
jgi:hypothetical protein